MRKFSAGVICLPILLAGCSNSDSSGELDQLVGRFLDAPVKGLEYTTSPSNKSGVTNNNGEYRYEFGDTVTFFIDGIEIGETEAAKTVPVTNLPKYLSVARVLQSLDTQPEDDGIIDISQIEIPDTVEASLESFLAEDTESDISEVLTDEALAEIEAASIEKSGDESIDIADTVVSTADAIDHLSGTVIDAFTAGDLAKQVFHLSYTDEDSGEEKLRTLAFLENGTAYIYKHPTDDEGASKSSVTWEIDDSGKLVLGAEEVYTLHSANQNDYATTAYKIGNEENVSSFVFQKVKTFSLASLGGAIFKDLSDDPECSARTFEMNEAGTVGTLKSICGDDNKYHKSTTTLAELDIFEDVVKISGEDADGPYSIMVALLDGEPSEIGSELEMIFLSPFDSDHIEADINRYEVVEEAVQEPVITGGFTEEDISGQVFTRGEGDVAVIMTFYTDGTGTEFNSGENDKRPVYSDEFNWSVVDGFLELDYSDDSNDVRVGLNSVADTAHAVTVYEEDGELTGTFYKAKSLVPADFAGKILSLTTPAEGASCEKRTFKVSDDASTADWKEICEGTFYESSGFDLSTRDDLDNVVQFTREGTDGGAYITLIEGDLETEAPVKLGIIFDKGEDEPEAVLFETYEFVDEELTAPSTGPEFTISDVAKQSYVHVESGMVLSFANDGTGIEFNDGDGHGGSPYTHEFDWEITPEGKLINDYERSEGGNVTVTLLEQDGNKYTVNALDDEEGAQPETIEIQKALPLSIADLEGKTISLDMSGDETCGAMTFSFTSTSAERVKICLDREDGIGRESYTLAESNSFDEVIVLESLDNDDGKGELSLILIDGSIESGQGTLIFLSKDVGGDIRSLLIHDFIVVDEESSLESTIE